MKGGGEPTVNGDSRGPGRRLVSAGYRGLLSHRDTAARLTQRARRKALLAQLKWQADAVGAHVDAQISLDVEIGRRVRVSFWPGSRNVLRIAPYVRIGDDVVLLLKGGEINLGDRVDIRHRCVLNISGRLEMVEDNILSWGGTIHCADHVRWEPMAAASEYVAVTDSSHYFTEPGAFFYHNMRAAPVTIGANTWLCTRAVVARGVSIGDHCIVAANSVVTSDVPSGSLASGVPATVRRMRLPWELEHGQASLR